MEPSEEVRSGRRALEGLKGFELLEDFRWWAEEKGWSLRCRLRPGIEGTEFVPVASDWFLLIDRRYPLGEIKVFPAKENGLTTTFPHQNFNGEGHKDKPWRQGKLCLISPFRALGRLETGVEPDDKENRLSWHVQRALQWLELASQDLLLTKEDYFELPAYPLRGKTVLAFQESQASLTAWVSEQERTGYAPLSVLSDKPRIVVVRSFATRKGRTVHETPWGFLINDLPTDLVAGWIRFDEVIVHSPWQAPTTWQGLIAWCRDRGTDLLAKVRPLLSWLRTQQERADQPHPQLLLVGFPIPEYAKGKPYRMHWLPIELPRLSSKKNYARGFRSNEEGYWMADRRKLQGDILVNWAHSECWDQEEIAERGKLPPEARNKRILLLGAGALGAALEELLVRAGVHSITILDPEDLGAGNLVRHTLTVYDLHQPKAVRVAQRLNRISPHAKAKGFDCAFPDIPEASLNLVREADVVVDCTGDNQILSHLEQYPWMTPKLFLTFSFGRHAKRFYGFGARAQSFPCDRFVAEITPWLELDKETSFDWARDGIGCWHQAFPTRCEDVWIWASVSLKLLEQWLTSPPEQPTLAVYERESDISGFLGIRRVDRA